MAVRFVLFVFLAVSSAFAQGAPHSAIRFTAQRANATAACSSASAPCLRVHTDGTLHYSNVGAGVSDFRLDAPPTISNTQTHGTLIVGGGLAGSDANNNLVLTYSPAEASTPPFGLAFYQAANANGLRMNQVAALGHNVGVGGAPIVLGEAQAGWSFESYYKPDGTCADTEAHLFMNANDGTGRRVLTASQDRCSGRSWLGSFSDEADLGNSDSGSGSGTLTWSTTEHSVKLRSPDLSHRLYVDNNQVIISAGGADVFTTGGTTDSYFKTSVSPYGAKDGLVDLGYGSNRWRSLQLYGGTARPACDSTARGKIWMSPGAAGVADKLEICLKDAADAYGWVQIAP